MIRVARRIWVPVLAAAALSVGIVVGAAEPILAPVKIDGPVHDPSNHTYWFGPFSECCSVADFDGDGDLDIAAGRNWYEAPDWKKHSDFRDGAETNGPETDNNSEFAMDVNRDGHMDIVSSGWMRMKGAFWYENPGPETVRAGTERWTAHRFHSCLNMEGVVHGDLDGDGDDDILCNHWGPAPGQGATWYESIDREPWLVKHMIGTQGEKHGNGIGDLNGDGRNDIVTPTGWYEAPPNPTSGKWTFHADYKIPGSGSHPLLVHDVNGDGRNDIVGGHAHGYGLYWMKQKTPVAGKRTFEVHWIEKDFGQFHTMALGDLNGDKKPDLVTGKRLFAHHGRDVSCRDPLFAFWYDFRGGQVERHILSFNHLPWYSAVKNHNPPPNGAIAVGMKLVVADIDKNGRNDVVVSGKSGLYVFYNMGDAPSGRSKKRLRPENDYPSWVPWNVKERKVRKMMMEKRKREDGPTGNAGAADDGFVTLFNGKNLDGWNSSRQSSWAVVDGVIAIKRDHHDGRDHIRDYLWANDMYGDFVLELEFKVAKKSNSGIFFRTADMKKPVYTGFEIQIAPPQPGKKPDVRKKVGALYDCQAPTRCAAKPVGEWNAIRITCRGGKIAVELNGEAIIDVDLDRWTVAGQNPDGSKNKFKRALKDYAREGYIGFQDHGKPVWYRNVRIRRLSEDPCLSEGGRNSM